MNGPWEPDDSGPYIRALVTCPACHHRWTAIRAASTRELECGRCHTVSPVMPATSLPPDDPPAAAGTPPR